MYLLCQYGSPDVLIVLVVPLIGWDKFVN